MNLVDLPKTRVALFSASHICRVFVQYDGFALGLVSSVRMEGGCMLTYHFDRLQDDGSWSGYDFTATSDDDAVAHALRKRTSNRCELYQAERWLATFDGVEVANDVLALMQPKVQMGPMSR